MNATVSSPLRLLLILQGLILAVTALYFGQPVLMPLAVAVLLTFMLRPSVAWLQRRRVPRVAAVMMVAAGIFTLLGGVGWLVGGQLYDLASHLDDYRGHLRARIEQVKNSRSDAAENVQGVIEEVTQAIEGKPPEGEPDANAGKTGEPSDASAADRIDRTPVDATELDLAPPAQTKSPADAETQVVRVVPETGAPAAAMRIAWDALSTPLGTAAVVTVLTIFMLLSFEDMRNRVLRLSGPTQLTLTTKTLDDVGKRISRYLTMNALVNGAFGTVVFAGLHFVGIDYAALWGFLAAVLRFVPYVGPIAAAFMPIAMSVIQFPFPDWHHPSATIALFVVLELITNNVVEPLAYGKSAGVSTVALLVSATFWAWIWGPMGLVLSVPLTVVLAVLGKHIPQFESLGVLLGDEPPLKPFAIFYQRLLADDEEEAGDMLEDRLAIDQRLTVYDSLLVPALVMAERDRHEGTLTEADKGRLWETARELIDDNAPTEAGESTIARRLKIAVCPAQDLADELAGNMLGHVVPAHVEIDTLPAGLMASEKVAKLEELAADAAVISALGPGGASQVRYLCKRLRAQFPEMKIVVARWGFEGDRARMTAGLCSRGADYVVTTLAEALEALQRVQPAAATEEPNAETVAARS